MTPIGETNVLTPKAGNFHLFFDCPDFQEKVLAENSELSEHTKFRSPIYKTSP